MDLVHRTNPVQNSGPKTIFISRQIDSSENFNSRQIDSSEKC